MVLVEQMPLCNCVRLRGRGKNVKQGGNYIDSTRSVKVQMNTNLTKRYNNRTLGHPVNFASTSITKEAVSSVSTFSFVSRVR